MSRWIFGAVGFVLGCLASGLVMYAMQQPIAPVSAASAAVQPTSTQHAGRALPQRVILQPVQPAELPEAVATMGLEEAGQALVRSDVESGRYRLIWLTIWDWDAQNDEDGDIISIRSGEYRRALKLRSRRHRIAIPEPRSGYIELRGEATGDGIIAISLLSGAHPIALPRMVRGQTATIDIDAP